MLSFPRPPFAAFELTLLPEQLTSANAAAARAKEDEMRTQSWSAATSMLQSILDLASDYTMPQMAFAHYSPEKIMRSVRTIVDDDRCAELLAFLQTAVRAYAVQCVAKIKESWRQHLETSSAKQPDVDNEERQDGTSRSDNETDSDDNEESGTSQSTLRAVRTLALLVAYFERLQRGVAELSSVWAYANQWCALQASREVPRSLTVACIQEASEVFRNASDVFGVALKGYQAVLKAELKADKATLYIVCASSLVSSSTSAAPATATSTTTAVATTNFSPVSHTPVTTKTGAALTENSVPLLYPVLASPNATATVAGDVQRNSAILALRACPLSLESLDTASRHRLLSLFTQLTRATQQYNSIVEPAVVKLVHAHFGRMARALWSEEMDAKHYFELSATALKHADTVHQLFLHSGTIPLVEDAIRTTLVAGVGAEVLKRDFTTLMEQEQYHTLRLSWRLLSASAHVRSTPAVVGLFREYFLECGQGIMEELVPNSTKASPAGAHAPPQERPFLAVRHLIGLLEQGSCTVEKCFHECEKEFKVALHEALQTILEAYPSAFSEQLAAYQDALMKEVEAGHVPLSRSPATTNAATPSNEVQNTHDKTAAAAAAALRTTVSSRQHDNEEAIAAQLMRERESDEEDEKGDEEAMVPLRRPREEPSFTAAATTAAMENAEATAPATSTATTGTPLLGAAALRHAAPLPAEAKEATPVLRRIAYIYSFHSKKDLFEAAYWRDFARRCLNPHRRVHVAAENAFIFYLRDICGLSFTSKFEGMLTDLDASAQLTTQFKTWSAEHPEENGGGAATQTTGVPAQAAQHVEVHLLILTQSFWPRYAPPSPSLYLTPPLQRVKKQVEQFYAGLFANRHLTWQHPLANATLRTQLTPQSAVMTLTGTYMQAILLMRLDALYDEGVQAVTVMALCAALGLNCANTEVLWSLQGLCHPRFRLVIRESKAVAGSESHASTTVAASTAEPAEDDDGSAPHTSSNGKTAALSAAAAAAHGALAPTDVLRLNLAFTSATNKVRIPLQTRARTTAAAGTDGGGRGARTADNGGHLVEVAIVSCLKARRTVMHAELAAAVHERLPFAVSVPVLKKAIDKLIERGFMVRDKDNTYRFSA